MKTRIIEASSGVNFGKILLMTFEENEWEYLSKVNPGRRLLRSIGWHERQFWMLDLQTCEGMVGTVGGYAKADLDKHQVWVCPLFEPTLAYLYHVTALRGGLLDIDDLPDVIELSLEDAPPAMYGYRRSGWEEKVAALGKELHDAHHEHSVTQRELEAEKQHADHLAGSLQQACDVFPRGWTSPKGRWLSELAAYHRRRAGEGS